MNFSDKKVLFITTKNLDYLRNTQEIELIRNEAKSLTVLGSNSKSYAKRLAFIYSKLIFMSLKRYDTIFVGFAPQLIIPIFSHRFKKKELIIDFFISVYDTLVFDRKKFNQKSVGAKICKKVDVKTLKKANSIICDTNEHGNYFSSEFGIERDKIHTLYLKADQTFYHPMNVVRPDNLKEKYVVLYFGSILPLQGIGIIMNAMEYFKNDERFCFYIIGPVKDGTKCTRADNIIYIEWLSQDELAKYIAMSDLCLAGHFNKEINKAKRTIPGKAYIYRAMNKPMILGDNAANRELYNESMEGIYFVPMGDGKALADKIMEVHDLLINKML